MKRFLGLLLVSALAFAATPGSLDGIQVSKVFPPRSLPAGTAIVLENGKGQEIWRTGQGMLPSAEQLDQVGYVVFRIPKGKTYRYEVVGKAPSLEGIKLRIGKYTYTLGTLLKNRHVAIGKDGNLVAAPAKAPAAHAPAAPKKP